MNLSRQFALGLAVFLAGCGSARNMNKLSVGMTKGEVEKVMGQPKFTSAKSGAEYLRYNLSGGHKLNDDFRDEYYVKLVEGKVESYGKIGDFETDKEQRAYDESSLKIRREDHVVDR
jgi:hypothetical protein